MVSAGSVVFAGGPGPELLRKGDTKAQVWGDIAQLALLGGDDAGQRRRAAALGAAAADVSNLQQQMAQWREQQGVTAAVTFISSKAYRSRVSQFEGLVERMRQREHALDAERRQHNTARTGHPGHRNTWRGLRTHGLAPLPPSICSSLP